MLERTVGCREPGSLRRLLPGTQRSLKSRRTLHSGFWHHGALELELSPLYSALLRSSTTQDRDCDARHQATSIVHAGFHLDFLYPTKALGFLGQYMGLALDRQDGQRQLSGFSGGGRRLYTASRKNSSAEEAGGASASSEYVKYSPADILLQPHHPYQALMDNFKPADSPPKIVGPSKESDYKNAWEQYLLLDDSEKSKARQGLIRCLSGSSHVAYAERIIEVFKQLHSADNDAGIRAIAIRSYLKLRNLRDAMALYKEAINEFEFPLGASDILSYMIENSLWTQAINFWIEFQSFREHFKGLSYNIYTVIESRSDLIDPAIELAGHVNARVETSSDPSKMIKFASKFVKRALVNSASAGDKQRFDTLLGIFQGWDLDLMTEYQTLLGTLLELKETNFAVRCYRKIRETHEVKFTKPTLHALLVVFCKFHSVVGIQQVMDDFFRFHQYPSSFAYKKCMKEFASQGDAETVHALFTQYLARCKLRSTWMVTSSDMAPILHVHARRGELSEVIRYFDEIQTVHRLQPDLLCWNILIDAYGKVRDSDGAFETFRKLVALEHLAADDYTFGTIMGICANRGDIERVIEAYQLSLSMKIETSASMVDCLVLAHIQDNRFLEAEKICEDALEMKLKGSKIRMWNSLLLAYGMRRDINKVNELLGRMSDANLEYDSHTYSTLMQALAMVGQSGRAESILNHVMKDAGVRITSFHYAIVMGSYLASGDFEKVFSLQKHMARQDVGHSASTKLLSIKAADQELFKLGTDAERGSRALEMFQETLSSMDQRDVSVDNQKGMHRAPRHIAYPTMLYSYVILVLGQIHEYETAEELYQQFIKTLPESERASPPLEALSAIMTAKTNSGDWKGVQEFWDLALSKAKVQGSRLQPVNIPSSSGVSALDRFNLSLSENEAPKILPIHQLDLTRCLSVYMNALATQGKAGSIPTVVDDLLRDGFLLDNRNWNQFIQILAQTQQFELAFKLCEQKLMDNWTGWASIRWQEPMRNRLPIELRKMRKHVSHLRPNTHTFLVLAKAYLDLQGMAGESRLGDDMLCRVCDSSPRTINAIKTMRRMDSGLERAILRDF